MTVVLGQVALWWLALAAIGWAAVPLAARLFPALPDRGWAFARPIGLLLAGYGFWVGGMLGIVPNSRSGAVFVVAALVAWGAWLALRDSEALLAFLRSRRRLVLGYEALFAVALVCWAVYRAYNPAIETAGGEKYMEMAFIDAVLASPRFPPLDPWLSGFDISYYYFGYLQAGLLIQLTGLLPYAAFNLVVPATLAMTLVAAFGLGYSLVRLSPGATRAAAVATGALSAALLAFVSSLEGALELAYLRGWLPQTAFERLAIKNLSAACGEGPAPGYGMGGWVPTRHIWWWRGSRVIHDDCREVIHEFPFFSFMLGDVHPHVMALPFVLTALALALSVLAGGFDLPSPRRLWTPRWLALPLVVGGLAFLNTWDLPTFGFVLVAAWALRVAARAPEAPDLEGPDLVLAGAVAGGVALAAWRVAAMVLDGWAAVRAGSTAAAGDVSGAGRAVLAGALVVAAAAVARAVWSAARAGDPSARRAVSVARFGAWLVVVGIALYLPFHLGFSSQAAGVGWVDIRSRLAQWSVHFGVPLAFAVTLVAVWLPAAVRSGRRLSWPSQIALTLAAAVCAYALAVAAWTAALLAVLAGAAALAALELWAAWMPGEPGEAGEAGRGPVAPVFALLCVAVGLLLPLGTEFVFIRDLFGSRMNTVFKLYYQAWVLLAVGGSYAAFTVWRRLPRWAAGLWSVPVALLLAAGLVYPAAAVHTRTRGFHADELTLDGLAWWQGGHAGDRAAVDWLKANAEGAPVILEAYGGGYEHNGRISMATGFPAVLGWEGHEHQWRGTRDLIDPRKADIEAIYVATSDEAQLDLLEKYAVRYVVLGAAERAKFSLSAADVERLERNLTLVFEAGDTRLFERR